MIDPYVGSGTTIVAAKLLGHEYIGIDISSEYIKMANSRIKKANSEVKIILEETSRHKVEKTFQQRKAEGAFVGKFRKMNNASNIKEDKPISTLFDNI